MRSFRIFLALLIALALPAQALADVRMAVACCPMSALDAPETMAPDHDCCHEHDANSSGTHCDEGTGCHCSIHLALAIHDFQPTKHELERYPAVFTTLPHSAPLAAHWRPPALRTDLI
ncbi:MULTISPECIES: hypothetical protein [unclassified Thiobacillus]|jgi:hypothetical protein|uniref:hypothetical protein n=1 Tax=unclassified Thiobacillus TaxID=2646513 RepID=UPI000959CE29|nr:MULTISPECIES: hypothetical protein [unclassified Thiobacillus]MBN8781193.1 hypothetical protein [Thiobacillus sp.]OJY56654.1 MAG: hypothetical protein BGP19_04715 [Thiobacillus sp. 0-1251]